jgi:hypothetical protein
MVALSDGSVCLRQTIHVNGTQVQLRHLFKEISRGWTGCHRHPDRFWEPLSLLGGTQQRVDCGSRIEMRYSFILQEIPDERVINLSETVMGASNSRDCPRERPA